MTMKELAALANVSVSAVSKAFSDAEDISAETKKHIFKIAKENGCYGKFYKGKYSKPIIAIICPELNGSFYSRYVERLRESIEENGGIALISVDHFEPEIQGELIEYYSSYLQVDGIFVIHLKTLLKKAIDTPIVSLVSSLDPKVDCIKGSVEKAFQDALSLLKGLGHTNIAFATEPLTTGKTNMFLELMGLPQDSESVLRSTQRFEKAGLECARSMLEAKTKYTAVFCAYDDIAYGVIKYLTEKGIRVPEDVSVVGMDNINTSGYLSTALTTIDFRHREICDAALVLLNKKMKNKYYKQREEISFEARLIVRDSTGKCNNEY